MPIIPDYLIELEEEQEEAAFLKKYEEFWNSTANNYTALADLYYNLTLKLVFGTISLAISYLFIFKVI